MFVFDITIQSKWKIMIKSFAGWRPNVHFERHVVEETPYLLSLLYLGCIFSLFINHRLLLIFCHYKYHLIAKVFFFTLSSIKIITLSWFFVLHCLPKIGNFLVMSLVPMVLITILNFLIYKKIHK